MNKNGLVSDMTDFELRENDLFIDGASLCAA